MNAGEIIAGQKFAGLMFADLPRTRKHLSRKVTLMKADPQTFVPQFMIFLNFFLNFCCDTFLILTTPTLDCEKFNNAWSVYITMPTKIWCIR